MKSNEKIGGKILQCHVVDTDRVIRHRTRCIIEFHNQFLIRLCKVYQQYLTVGIDRIEFGPVCVFH